MPARSASDPIADAVFRELDRRSMTVCALARSCGVHRLTLGRWINGTRSIRVKHAVMAMAVLGLVVVRSDDLPGKTAAVRPASGKQ